MKCTLHQKGAQKLTQLVKLLIKISDTDRLVHLGALTLKYRRLCGDIIEVCKYEYDYTVAPELIYNIMKVTMT